MARCKDEDMEDENPLYIRISRKKYAELLDSEEELVRVRSSLQRTLRPKRKNKE